jgi:hypothetical protein
MPHTASVDPRALTPASAEQHSEESIGLQELDPETGLPWSRYMDTDTARRYLAQAYGIKIAKQTLAHQRSRGRGIHWRYIGQKPVTTRGEIDRYIREDAFSDESPLARTARARAAARSAAGE